MNAKVIKAAVIGHPVAHSKSPMIHQHWFGVYGIDGVYDRIDIPSEADLAYELRRLVQQEGYSGFNITLPHKQAALVACDTADDLARDVGAVNTIMLQDGRLHGTNTDVFGFAENLRDQAPDFAANLSAAIVLGAGGAARSAIYALLQQNCSKIYVVSRSIKSSEKLANQGFSAKNIEYAEWQNCSKIMPEAQLLVNATPLGMAGQEKLDLALDNLPENAAVYDLVYTPLATDLLRRARARKLAAIDGLGMLLHQARPAFKAWTGIMPDIDDALRKKVLA